MKIFIKSNLTFLIGILIICGLGLQFCTKPNIKKTLEIDRLPSIDPDYSGIVIPPNIAPLNFKIKERAADYYVEIYTPKSEHNRIHLQTGRIVKIPRSSWRHLLSRNRGQELLIDVYFKEPGLGWQKYHTIKNYIANQKIDSHVAYRLINPGYVLWWDMGIYQRNLENFNESPIFTNRVTKHNCMNCHSFCNHNPEIMLFHMRGNYGGTMFIKGNKVQKINTKTDYTMSAGVYPAWHPDGRHVAFSVNRIVQSFHAQKDASIHVWDNASDLVVYDTETNLVTTSPRVSTKRLENLPEWSPDSKYLYFCSGPEVTQETKYNEYRYDLMRISYNVETNQWGKVEPVLLASQLGKSVSFPKISPDGKYLLFTMSDFGYFAIHFNSSELYLLDLTTGAYRQLPVNSPSSESYHSWSSNGHWFVFASKRRDGLCSRLYISYLDSAGNAAKPFQLPQKDPEFYDTFIMNYNVPELIAGSVDINRWQLFKAARGEFLQAKFDPAVDVDALSGASKVANPQK
jgi:hypothetical protein